MYERRVELGWLDEQVVVKPAGGLRPHPGIVGHDAARGLEVRHRLAGVVPEIVRLRPRQVPREVA